MSAVSNITLHLPPPLTTDIETAYVKLVLGAAHHNPALLHTYFGPAEWSTTIAADPPSPATLRQQAIDVATMVQQSQLPRHRRDWLLRNIRALLWLARSQEGEQVMFVEQVRLLLDLPPESAGELIFQTAHEGLATCLPGSGALAERWVEWQASHIIPIDQAQPLLNQALDTLRTLLGHDNPLVIPPPDDPAVADFSTGATVRADRLFHQAAQIIVEHTLHMTAARRYAEGQGESVVLLNQGPEQVIRQGLPQAILAGVDIYTDVLPKLMNRANLPPLPAADLQAIHLAEDALAWAVSNTALLLHSEGLRPRALRRHLTANALISSAEANDIMDKLADPIEAAHIFAPLIGGPLLTTWLGHRKHTLSDLLLDPPVPSMLLYEVSKG
ncbi:MAG: hypothetical protein KDJ52_16860 [Anaerolineae bacterium]|nr:hypothetical protein [Anaerolineae bacterium]